MTVFLMVPVHGTVFRTVAACDSANISALATNRRLLEGNLEGLASPDDGWPSGSSDAGTLTKAPQVGIG